MAFKKHPIGPKEKKVSGRSPRPTRSSSGQTKAARAESQRKYGSKPSQIKRRSERNKTRRMLEKQGVVHKGDGKDVDHQNGNTADMSSTNIRVIPASKNRRANRR